MEEDQYETTRLQVHSLEKLLATKFREEQLEV